MRWDWHFDLSTEIKESHPSPSKRGIESIMGGGGIWNIHLDFGFIWGMEVEVPNEKKSDVVRVRMNSGNVSSETILNALQTVTAKAKIVYVP